MSKPPEVPSRSRCELQLAQVALDDAKGELADAERKVIAAKQRVEDAQRRVDREELDDTHLSILLCAFYTSLVAEHASYLRNLGLLVLDRGTEDGCRGEVAQTGINLLIKRGWLPEGTTV